MKKIEITWDNMNTYVRNIIRQMVNDDWIPDIVVGITTGAVPAVMISNYMRRPLFTLSVTLSDYDIIGPETNCWLPELACEGKKILIVNDINDSGQTINWIVDDWNSSYVKVKPLWETNIRFATVIDNLSSETLTPVTYSAIEINKAEEDCFIVFPYEEF